MAVFTPTPCLVLNCKNSSRGIIYIQEMKIKKGFSAPGAKGYSLCMNHINQLKKVGEVTIQDYE